MTKFDCPACGRWIGGRAAGDTIRLARHRYTGETPSRWLRPGERCPGSFIDVDQLDRCPDGIYGLPVEAWLRLHFRPTNVASDADTWDWDPRGQAAGRYMERLRPAVIFTAAAGSLSLNGRFGFTVTITP